MTIRRVDACECAATEITLLQHRKSFQLENPNVFPHICIVCVECGRAMQVLDELFLNGMTVTHLDLIQILHDEWVASTQSILTDIANNIKRQMGYV